MAERFFTLVNKQSRFWLPAVLNEIARIPPSLCRGDGCSIFLVHGEDETRRLHLAATTRRERFSDLFEPRISYSVNPKELTSAAELYDRHGIRVPDASLSGWVAAFNYPLNIKDLHKEPELRAAGTDGRPRPVWSEKSRGPQDDNVNVPRPFLCVPMRACADSPTESVVGVIRIATTGLRSVPFEDSAQASLQEFANALADFLVECGALTSKELSYAFSIWSASDAAELADRITKAVPMLFDVECCSCFLRDPLGRFVLRKSNPRTTSETFQKFVDGNVDKLFYKAGDGSKTALCIDTQLPIVLVRENQRWMLESSEGRRYHEAGAAERKRRPLHRRRFSPGCDLRVPARPDAVDPAGACARPPQCPSASRGVAGRDDATDSGLIEDRDRLTQVRRGSCRRDRAGPPRRSATAVAG